MRWDVAMVTTKEVSERRKKEWDIAWLEKGDNRLSERDLVWMEKKKGERFRKRVKKGNDVWSKSKKVSATVDDQRKSKRDAWMEKESKTEID